MKDGTLRCGGIVVKVEAGRERLMLERDGKPLPWEIDLGASTSLTVRPKTRGGEKTVAIDLAEMTPRRLAANRMQWIGEIGGAGVALEIELTAEGPVFAVSPIGTGDAAIVSATWPGEVRLMGNSREVCWSDHAQGALFRADGKPWTAQNDWRHTAGRFFGFTCDGQSLAVIVETPFDASVMWEDDGASAMTSRLTWNPSMGTLSYGRRIRFIPLAETGYVAVANAFRDYAQKHGLWKSFDERVAENPNVGKLRGAFMACAGYWWDEKADQVAAMRRMREFGFEHGYLFSPKLFSFGSEWSRSLGVHANRMSDDAIRAIQDLGYLCSPFLQVEEASEDIGAEKFAIDAKGKKIVRWQIGEDRFYEIAKWRVPAMLPVFDEQLQSCSAIHFDTLTAMRLVENHGERPYDIPGDARLRTEVADYYRRRGKLICSESQRDWGIARVDLSTSKSFAPISQTDARVWTVPLTDLVWHDSTPRTHWEHHSYDDDRGVRNLVLKRFHPFGMELDDLLTASPPVLFPEGMLYYYELKPVTHPDGRKDVEVDWTRAHLYRKRITDRETLSALPKALRVCRLNERHGVSRMLTHRFLDPTSPMVQESEFASGLHVIVNFGNEPFALSDGRTVGARSSVVEE